MCGRFAVGDPDAAAWAEWLGTETAGPWPEPNWNVAPTQTAAIVTAQGAARRQRLARWGLVPRWWKRPLAELRAATFNARSEEAAQKPMFRDAWRHARCLVPALGYYEWTGAKGAKQPWFVTLKRNAPGICFAGLWAEATVEGERLTSFTILTTAAGEATAHLHPRTPVILAESDWPRWLEPGSEAMDLMRAPPDAMVEAWRVDRAVGRVANNGPELIEPAGLAL
jgi:putative SOS response-associated peptidase YedK